MRRSSDTRLASTTCSRRCGGFTLIELLVVIVILGILMAVAVPTFLSQQTRAQDSRTQQYLTTAFKAIRSGLPDTNDQYPSSTSMVSWIQQSEPELTAERGDCLTGVTSAPVDAVLVDPSSTATSLQLCARSQSGNVWKLTATATGVQQLLDGTLVPLTVSGNEITDATRAAGVQGDGLSNDSSTGIWEGTTNLVTNGGVETDLSTYSALNGATLSRDTSTFKFGAASIKAVTPGAVATEGFVAHYTPPAGTYTLSAWVKAPAGSSMEIYLDNTNSYFTGTGDWQHVSATETLGGGTVTVGAFTSRNASPQAITFWVDGIQLEQKAYATPYVETNGATSTRNAARVEIPASSLLNGTQSWIAMRVRMDAPSTTNFFFNWSAAGGWAGVGGSNNGYSLAENGSTVFFNQQVGGVSNGGNPSFGGAGWSSGTLVTIVAYWKSSGLGLSIDGANFITASSLGTPSGMGQMDVGSVGGGADFLDGDVLWFACGTGTLSDSDAATINSWGNNDPARSSFPTSAQATMVWNGVGATGSLK